MRGGSPYESSPARRAVKGRSKSSARFGSRIAHSGFWSEFFWTQSVGARRSWGYASLIAPDNLSAETKPINRLPCVGGGAFPSQPKTISSTVSHSLLRVCPLVTTKGFEF